MKVGLTDCQARKLLELAENAGCIAKVRTFRKDTNHTHSGRAFLIGLVNKTEARIKPFTHRKEEVVPLSTLRFWKSGCAFDISEAEAMTERKTNTPIESLPSQRYVIYSEKAEGVWAGQNRKWIKNVQSAIFYRDQAHAESTIAGMAKTYASDAILLPDTEAASRFRAKPLTQPTQVVEQPVVVTRVGESIPVSTISVTDTEKTMIDEYTLGFDPVLLAKAAEDYKKLVDELKAVEALKQETVRKLEAVKKSIADMVGTQKVTKAESEPVAKRTQVKPGAVKKAVLTVLKSCSRLDLQSLVARANPLTPASSRGSVKQAVYKCLKEGLIERNANGFALTTLGRQS
jgi:hypothetical protein